MDETGKLIEQIQKELFEEVDRKFADETFLRLRCSLYNKRMHNADAQACMEDGQGNMMEFYLRIDQGKVIEASYLTDGTVFHSLCGSSLAGYVLDRPLEDLAKVDVATVVSNSGRNYSGMNSCAFLAIETLHKAIEQYVQLHSEPDTQKQPTRKTQFVTIGPWTRHTL